MDIERYINAELTIPAATHPKIWFLLHACRKLLVHVAVPCSSTKCMITKGVSYTWLEMLSFRNSRKSKSRAIFRALNQLDNYLPFEILGQVCFPDAFFDTFKGSRIQWKKTVEFYIWRKIIIDGVQLLRVVLLDKCVRWLDEKFSNFLPSSLMWGCHQGIQFNPFISSRAGSNVWVCQFLEHA